MNSCAMSGVLGLRHTPGEPPVRRRVVARYFPARAELTGILREFTAGLFGAAAGTAGKRTWCEKTPFNLLSAPFLLELFPEATVVVIMRHPVHVAASHLDQPWAPSTLEGVLGWLEPVYRRWLAQRAVTDRAQPTCRSTHANPPIWRVVSPRGRSCSSVQNEMIGGSQSIFAISLTSLPTSESVGAA